MAFWNRNKDKGQQPATGSTPTDSTPQDAVPATFVKADLPAVPTKTSGVVLTKSSGMVSLAKAEVYTIIARWGRKDYDVLVQAVFRDEDGTIRKEWVSTYGTMDAPKRFSAVSSDGSVVHASGDKATSDAGGDEPPFEVVKIYVRPGSKLIRAILVVYSAKNSGPGSFFKYGVSTYVLPGDFNEVPDEATIAQIGGHVLLAEDASRDDGVYTFVPAVIIIDDKHNAYIDPVELYSEGGENRPDWDEALDEVIMDVGPENASKPRPKH